VLSELERIEEVRRKFDELVENTTTIKVEVSGSFLVRTTNKRLLDLVVDLIKLGVVVDVNQYEGYEPKTSKRLRQAVLNYLKKVDRYVSVAELSYYFRVSPSTVRKVMRDLVRMGFVEAKISREDGRTKLYKLKDVESCVLIV